MSRLRLNKISTPGTPAASKGELYFSNTLSPATPAWIDETGKPLRLGGAYTTGATAAVGGGFAADTYITGCSINIGTAGAWRAGMVYRAVFDMVKTAAGTAAATIIIRMGTLGTTGDAAILTHTWAAGTAAADTGVFIVNAEFRSVGSGTAAVIASLAKCHHHLAATGLVSTGASGFGLLPAASAGFDSTISNIMGISFNGGASFSGTNVASNATLEG